MKLFGFGTRKMGSKWPCSIFAIFFGVGMHGRHTFEKLAETT
jgi:hypothetical protein